MIQLNIPNAARDQRGAYKVDVSRGERIGRVSSEWFSRPADERYLSLSELFGAAAPSEVGLVQRKVLRSEWKPAATTLSGSC